MTPEEARRALEDLSRQSGASLEESDVTNLAGKNPEDVGGYLDALRAQYAQRGSNVPGGGGGGGGGDVGSFVMPSMPSLPTLRPMPVPNLPTPEKPPPFAYSEWRAPSVEQVMADPSYQWRKQQGEESLQRWAAAKGTLNDSGTAKALIDYGQGAASQEYGNVYGREFDIYRTNRAGALDTYNTNYQTQYVDPYRFEYQRGLDLAAPEQAAWMTEADLQKTGYLTDADARRQTQQLSYTDAFNRWLANLEEQRWQKRFEFDVTSED